MQNKCAIYAKCQAHITYADLIQIIN